MTLQESQLDVSMFGDVSLNERATTTTVEPEAKEQETNEEEKEEKVPLFSSLHDPTKHNCRVVSRATINRINMTDFQWRKRLQEAKMRHIKANMWKIDWHYKIAKKIKVYAGKGKCFAPHKSTLTVQNEDGLLIFWKFYSGTESIEMASKDLRLLKKRNDTLGETLHHCHVDNCCSVPPKMQQIVGSDVSWPGLFPLARTI